ncbi:hypothetical protein JTA33_04435 [Pseudomonas sp. 20GA0080]|uniref:TIM-barrel domain-containing protein n=1 Tax=Pseudomonas alliivorans TaxID=2810613 RepID=UPI001AE88820|nr:TIM-barrel domain-containing protein [Pseudomonas alliivorans]MBP0949692.1 hypothetical protein [Pseudomonas alliivorans]
MFLNDPQDPGVYQHLDDQFFVGRDILVAPIVTAHATANPPTTPSRDIYLPNGSQWYAFVDDDDASGAPVEGGTLVTGYYADLDRVPVTPEALQQSAVDAYYYNSSIKQVFAKLVDTRADVTLQMLFP